jgi:AraC-like DNA-binding protein
VHHFFELVYIERGPGSHRIGNQSVSVEAGDLFVIAPGEVHDSSGLTPASRWVVAFGADALDPARPDTDMFLVLPDGLLLLAFFRPTGASNAPLRIPRADRRRWRERLGQLVAELGGQRFGNMEAARALLTLLLTDTARIAAPHPTSYAPATRPLLTRVFRFIEAHYREPISLQDVSAAVGHAPTYLTSLVRRETGRTVLTWIVERRMATARYLLLETDQSVQQVASAVGYRHTGLFIRQFSRLHGTTPHAWRVAQGGGQRPA